MAKFLIEVAHAPEVVSCVRAVDAFLRTGSHFLTHADWGCKDGVHKAWFVADVESKTDALAIVPVDFKADTTIVQLNSFTMDEVEQLMRDHAEE